MIKYGFIGTGNMAQAIITGLLNQHVPASHIGITSPHSAARLAEKLGVVALSPQALIDKSTMIILACLPNQLANVTSQLDFKDKLVVSVLAGVSVAKLVSATRTTQVVRTLPNINVAVNLGVTAFYQTRLTAENNRAFQTFSTYLGESVQLDESQFSVFSAIAGSGPAYVFKFIEALVKSGVSNGLGTEMATKIVTQTVFGTAKTLANSSQTAEELQNVVASPGGSTCAGLAAFNDQHFDEIILNAIQSTIEHKHL